MSVELLGSSASPSAGRRIPAGLAVVLAALLFLAAAAVRVAVSSPEPITFLNVVPVVFVAVRFGSRAGLGAALLAIALSAAARSLAGLDVTVMNFFAWALVFIPLSFLLGRSIARTRTAVERMDAAVAESSTDVIVERERRFEEAQAIAEVGSWDWDLTTRELVWSRQLWQILGLTPDGEPASFERFAGCLHPEDRVRVTAMVEHSLASGESFQYTARIVRPGGTGVIEALGEVVMDDDGNAVRMFGTAQDVTSRTEADTQLNEAEQKLRLLVERIPAVTYTAHTGEDGRWLWVSPQVEQLLGYPPEEWLANPTLWYDSIHPDDREVAMSSERAASDEGRTMTSEYRMVARDGHMIWVRDEGTLLCAAPGERQLMEGVLSDITQRKLAEEALRESERRYRTIVETTREGIWLVDADGLTSFVNGRMAEMLGETVDSMQGRSMSDFLSPECERALRESSLHGEVELQRADGTPVWTHVSTSPIVEDGEQRGQLAVVSDVTEQRGADEERRQLEGRIRQHERMESVGQLAGGIAHDFNNLLAVILACADLASAELEGSPAKADVDEIARAAERAAALTRQLLVFSRRELPRPEVCDLNEVVAETESMLRRTLGENLILEVSCQEDLWPLKADRGQLEQVLLNLAINARDAMQRGGRLTIETSNVQLDDAFAEQRGDAAPGPYVRLSVADTGTGMSPEVIERVYEPFFTTKPTGQGTGLGLATVYGIVQQAGGRIDIYSEPGVGTVFKVYFPLTLDDALVAVEQADPDGALTGNGEKVLVVEDDDAVRRVVRRVLAGAGYQVVEAGDPRDGLALFERIGSEVDMLLTDVVMPGMSGRELVDKMRATRPGLKVLLSSGYTDDEVMREGIAQEQTPFIEKPYGPDALLRKVREVLDAPSEEVADKVGALAPA